MAANFVQFFVNSLPDLMNGLANTFLLTFVAITTGFFVGLSLALGRIYGKKTINWFCIGYIEVIRGTPLLVQLFIIYFGLPSIGVLFTPLQAALIGLAINSGAYQAEYLRGSIQSNEFIYLLQYSSSAYIIQVSELTAEGKFIAAHTFRYLEIFAMIAIIYLILTIVSTEIIDRIAKRLSIPGIGAAKGVNLRDV
jgi:polar amino acid transport system permease protein